MRKRSLSCRKNKELVAHATHVAAVTDSRLKEETRQNNEMARLRHTDETYYEWHVRRLVILDLNKFKKNSELLNYVMNFKNGRKELLLLSKNMPSSS